MNCEIGEWKAAYFEGTFQCDVYSYNDHCVANHNLIQNSLIELNIWSNTNNYCVERL